MCESTAALCGTDDKCATTTARRPQRYAATVPAASANGAEVEANAAQPAVLRSRQTSSAPDKLRGAAAASSGDRGGLPNGSAAGRGATPGGGASAILGDAPDDTTDAADELGAIPGVSQTGMGFGGGRFR